MFVNQETLVVVSKQTTLAGGLIELIRGLIGSGAIPQPKGDEIIAELNAKKAEIEAALAKGVTTVEG